MVSSLLVKASEHCGLERIVTRNGISRRLALRFVAGEHLEDGLHAAGSLAAAGRLASLDYVGEHIRDLEDARAAAGMCHRALDGIAKRAAQVGVHVTLDMEDATLTEPPHRPHQGRGRPPRPPSGPPTSSSSSVPCAAPRCHRPSSAHDRTTAHRLRRRPAHARLHRSHTRQRASEDLRPRQRGARQPRVPGG